MDEVFGNETLRLFTAATRMSTVQPASFVDVDSFMTPQEIRDDPVRIRLRAHGLGAHACSAIPMPSGEIAMFVFQRGLEDGAYKAEHFVLLDGMRPDMARASLASARLDLKQAQSTVEALALIGLPAAVLSANGRVKATNALFDRESALFVPTAFGGLSIANPEGNRLFQLALRASERGTDRSIHPHKKSVCYAGCTAHPAAQKGRA
jgi:hypothetical protein